MNSQVHSIAKELYPLDIIFNESEIWEQYFEFRRAGTSFTFGLRWGWRDRFVRSDRITSMMWPSYRRGGFIVAIQFCRIGGIWFRVGVVKNIYDVNNIAIECTRNCSGRGHYNICHRVGWNRVNLIVSPVDILLEKIRCIAFPRLMGIESCLNGWIKEREGPIIRNYTAELCDCFSEMFAEMWRTNVGR